MGYGSDADALVHFGEFELLSIHLYFLLHGFPFFYYDSECELSVFQHPQN